MQVIVVGAGTANTHLATAIAEKQGGIVIVEQQSLFHLVNHSL